MKRVSHLRCQSDWSYQEELTEDLLSSLPVYQNMACGIKSHFSDEVDWNILDESIKYVTCPECKESDEYRNRILQRELTR